MSACVVTNQSTDAVYADLNMAIRAAAAGTTLAIQGTCTGEESSRSRNAAFIIDRSLTLEGKRTHWQDAWQRLHREPVPGEGPAEGITWSSENEQTRPLRSLDLDRRIDYVLVTTRKKDGRGSVCRCEVVLTERDDAGVCASDHYGVFAEVQIG